MATAKQAQVIITANASAAQRVMEELDAAAKKTTEEMHRLADEGVHLKERMSQLAAEGKKDTEEYRKLKEELKQNSKAFKQAEADFKSYNSAIRENVNDTKRVEEVIKNLAGTTTRDLRRALQAAKREMEGLAENGPKRAKLTEELAKIARQIDIVGGKSMSLAEAKKQLNDLVNTPTDKLKQGLEALRTEYSKLSAAQQASPQGAVLSSNIKDYEAQIALNKLGPINTAKPNQYRADELRQEQARLQQALSAVSQGPMYGAEATQIHQRLKDVTNELNRQTEAARNLTAEQKKAAQNADQGIQTRKTLANIETASYEELENALKFLEERHKKLHGTETKRIRQSLANQDKVKRKMQEIQKTMLTDQQINDRVNNSKKYSVIQLQQAYDQLKIKLTNLKTGEVDAIKETRKQMNVLQREIEQTQGKVTGLAKIWQTAVKNIGAYMGVFALAGYAKSKLQELVGKNYELSDAIMNVRKVSQLSVTDINELYKNISKIDTRNTVNTLMNLAYQGGKLGIGNYGVEGLSGFVRAAEQVQMALGEDLGEEALPALAKLTENMGLIKDLGVEQAMQKTASAMFTLSTTSVSTGQGIVDFSKRLMPVAKSAGVTTDQLLGLASATESSGLAAEVAATAFVKMFPSIYKNSAALESYLGLQKGFIRESYEQGKAMDAMVAIFDRMKQMGNINKYPEIFKLLGSEGARMNTVMTAMANNVDMLRDHLSTSNIAFKEGTAIINEYLLQNNSAAGVLERANNIWEKAFVNPEGVDMVKEMAQQWYNLSKELTESATWMGQVQLSLKLIAGVIATIIKLAPTLIKAMMFYGIATSIRKIYIQFTMLNTSMAAAATTAGKLSAFMKSNIWVLAGTAIMFAASAIIDMAVASGNAKKEAEAMGDALKQASDEGERASARERAELKRLYDATQNQKLAIEERTKAALEMKRKYPEYFSDLTTEQILAGKAAEAYQNLAQQILNAAKARAMEKKIEDLQTENMNLEDDNRKRERWRQENQTQYNKEKAKNERTVNQQNRMEVSGADGVGSKIGYVHASNTGDRQIIGQYQANDKAIEKNSKKMAENSAAMAKLSEEINKIKPASTTVNPETFVPGSGSGDDSGSGSSAKAPEWMVEEKKEAEKATRAVIGSIEEFYRLQEAAANELAANGQLKGSEFDMLVKHIQDRKDKMLLEARRAIVGDPNDFENIRQTLAGDIIKRDDAVSQAAMQRIQEADPAKKGAVLRKYDGSDAVFGLDSNAWLNDIRKNAAQNELNIQRREAQMVQEIDKFIMQFQFVEKAQQDFGDELVKLGLVSDGYAKVVKQLADGTVITANTKEVQQFANKVSGMGSQLYGVDVNSADELARMTKYMMTGADGQEEGFASIFPDYKKWIEQPEQYKEKMVALYELMIQYEGIYYDQIKKRDDLQNKRLDSWWDHSNEKKTNDQTMRDIQLYEFQYNTMKDGETMGYMMGLTNDVNQDPEVLREQAILDAKIAIWKRAKEEREAGLISEEVYQERLRAMQDASMKYTETVMANINKRIDRVKNFIKPFETAANNIGQKFGEMISGVEEESMTWNEIWHNMLVAVGESVIQMGAQYAQNLIMQQTMNRASEAETAAHTTAEVTAGIAAGSAKTIGTLGWWGIPLIAVISSLLMGLLRGALSNNRGSSNTSSSTTSSGSTPKIKLVSGMLTYDEGNVGTYAGTDGHVYRARAATPPEGVSLVTRPIATTVQGQPALVAERGPEIVIGRRTTRAIQMNEPELLHRLAQYDRFHSGGRLRTFDDGNVGDMMSIRNNDNTSIRDNDDRQSAAIGALSQVVAELSQTVLSLQQKGIPAHIQKYGAGGLIDEVKSGLKFDSRYNR